MEREYGEESVSWSANTETPEERHRRIYGPADPFGRAQWLRERADTLDAEGRLLRGTCFLGGHIALIGEAHAGQRAVSSTLSRRSHRQKGPQPWPIAR